MGKPLYSEGSPFPPQETHIMAFPEGRSERPLIPFLTLSKRSSHCETHFMALVGWLVFVCFYKENLNFACQQDLAIADS